MKLKLYYKFEFWIRLQSFKRKIENITHLQKRTLDNQECKIDLKKSTSEMAHAGMKRENTPAKQYQDKVWATKAQQDWPVNVTTNSWPLAYKVE
jgi:hypothetical protein